jgi:UDP-N-acetylglucosamine:LPS N-acetylglucosamine transferase
VENIGGGYVIGNNEANGESLNHVLKHLMTEPDLLRKMGENIGKLYVDDAEERIIKHITETIDDLRPGL